MAALRPEPVAPRCPAELPAPAESPEELDGLFQVEVLGADFAGLDVDGAEVEQCRFGKLNLAGARGRGYTMVDCVVNHSDLANAVLESAGLRRVEIVDSRLTGLSCIDSHLRDVVFRDSKMDLTNWRATGFVAVHFVRCDLTRADFAGADLRGVQFLDCTLTGAQFSQAKTAGARFAGCELTGIGGVASLAGATVRYDDMAALLELMADALGITIEAS